MTQITTSWRKRTVFVFCVVMLLATLFTVPAQASAESTEVAVCTRLTESIATPGIGAQGGAGFGEYYVQTITGGTHFYLYDLDSQELIADIPFEGDGGSYKNNNANFGTEYYDPSDPMPLLYVSSAYDYRIIAFRIYQDEGIWTIEAVQVIEYPTINNNAGFYSCNVLLDNDNGYMYLTPLSKIYSDVNGNVQMFYKFEMPLLSDGDVVSLELSDAVETFSTDDYIFAPQGAIIKENKIYQVHGIGNAFLRVFDLHSKKFVATYKLFDNGYDAEPESITFYNGAFYSFDVYLRLWKIEICEGIPSGAEDGKVKVQELTDWELGSIDLSTGEETVSNKIARTSNRISTLGANKVIIEDPAHYSGDINPGTFYKWRVVWYNGNTCLGMASEQTTFATLTEFSVPHEADSFRLNIASVIRGVTEGTFQLSSFDGMDVKFFSELDSSNDGNAITRTLTNWELGSISPTTGTENNQVKIARTENCIFTLGAAKVTIDLPVHYTGATTDNTYYKWRIVWFNGDTCLGMASEQTDFAIVSDYTVPENADSFRLTIASVVNGITETVFPLDTFVTNGGITLHFITS